VGVKLLFNCCCSLCSELDRMEQNNVDGKRTKARGKNFKNSPKILPHLKPILTPFAKVSVVKKKKKKKKYYISSVSPIAGLRVYNNDLTLT
jgi:hypothetical protein